MTTAHRPTFDHAKGKQNENRTHIVHKRFLPAHTQLKYRHAVVEDHDDDYGTDKIDLSAAKKSVEELRLELMEKEIEHYQEKGFAYKDRYLPGSDVKAIEVGDHADPEEDIEKKMERLARENGDASSEDESGSDHEDEDEEDDEDEDDEDEDEEAALMAEFMRLKQLKAEKEKLALHDNKVQEMMAKEGSSETKKGWRDETAFSNRRQKRTRETDSPEAEYINDMLRDNYHKKFMDKYVR